MVITAPVNATMNPAPVLGISSRTCTRNPLGAPSLEASSVKEYWVLAMHTGSPDQPFFSISARRLSAGTENSTPSAPVDLLHNRLDLVHDAQFQRVQVTEVGRRIQSRRHFGCELVTAVASASVAPNISDGGFHAFCCTPGKEPLKFLGSVASKLVDGYNGRNAELRNVAHVPFQVLDAGCHGLDVWLAEFLLGNPALHFEGADCCNHHDGGWRHIGDARLISMYFSAPRSAPKPASVTTMSASCMAVPVAIRELQPWAMFAKGPPCTNAGVPAMVWTRFGLMASFRSIVSAPSTPRSDTVTGGAIVGVPEGDAPPQPGPKVVEVRGEAEDRHDFRGDGDVEAVLPRYSLYGSAETNDNFP